MATRDGLNFGTDIVVQYGPLGFLKFPTTFDLELAAWSFTYVVTVQVLTAGLLVWAAHRWSGRWTAAAAMAAIATSLLAEPRTWQLGSSAPVYVLAVVACAHVVRGDAPPWLGTALAFGGGGFVGIEVLGKVNLAVLVGVMVVFTLVVAPDRARHLTRFGLTFLVTVTSAWFLTGQSITSVDDYVRMSVEVLRGWPVLSSTGGLGLSHLLALLAASLTIAAGWLTTRTLPTNRRVLLLALVAFFLLITFKSTFSIPGGRTFIYFNSAVGLWFAFRWGSNRMLPLAAFAALVAIYFVNAALIPTDITTKTVAVGINPLNNRPTSLLDTLGPNEARARLRGQYQLSARPLELIGSRSVHIHPGEASLAWAYELNWRPIPVFEPQMVTTRTLDQLNATSLESAGGPSRVLLERSEIGLSSTPATTVAMLCHFRQLYADSRWQVLARGSNRCGRERIVRRVTVQAGQTIRVPQIPDAMVRAKIHGLDYGFLEVAAIGFLPRVGRSITIDGVSDDLVPDKASAGVMLRVPPELDYPGASRVSPQAETISLGSADGPFTKQRDITVEFHASPHIG